MASRQINRCASCHSIYIPSKNSKVLCPSCSTKILHTDTQINNDLSPILTQLSPPSSPESVTTSRDATNNTIIEIVDTDDDVSANIHTSGSSNGKVKGNSEVDNNSLVVESLNISFENKQSDSTHVEAKNNENSQKINVKKSQKNPIDTSRPNAASSTNLIENHNSISTSSSTTQQKKNKMLDTNYECFICGHPLSSDTMRGRVMHIKRCAKKYNVSARDLKLNELEDEHHFTNLLKQDDGSPVDDSDDHDENDIENYVQRNNFSTSSLKNTVITIDDDDDDYDDGEDYIKNNNDEISESTTIASPISVEKTNVNNVLMLNAKKLAQLKKQKEIQNKEKPSLTNVLMSNARKLAQDKKTGVSKKRGAANSARGNSKFGRGSQNQSCPAFKIIAGTINFICDGFQYASKQLSTTYFLSHFHYDHYGGITSKWDIGRIYCSIPTANLVEKQLGVKKEFIYPLPLNEPTTIPCSDDTKSVVVTLLDANHCPGAVMFLFELSNKRKILHVGDFRWDRKRMLTPLNNFVSLKHRLDDLYLDTTYCDEKYTLLPSQDEVIHATIGAVERIMDSKPLLLFGSYSIGKERIYLAVAKHLGKKVFVDKKRYKMLSLLNLPKDHMNLLTTNQSDTCLWVVPLGHINFQQLKKYFETNSMRYKMIVGVRPTGWAFDSSSKKQQDNIVSIRKNKDVIIYDVPYSEHSSFAEIVDCIKCLKPRKIIPTVNVRKSQEQVDLLLNAVNERKYK